MDITKRDFYRGMALHALIQQWQPPSSTATSEDHAKSLSGVVKVAALVGDQLWREKGLKGLGREDGGS